MLRAENVKKHFSAEMHALKGVSLSVESGQIYCLLGPNGAGKSTLLHIFLDFLRPTSGHTVINDVCVQEAPLEAKRNTAYLPDNVVLYSEMTATDNLTFFGKLTGRSWDREDSLRLLDKVRIDRSRADDEVGRYSKGMRQKLGLAVVLTKGATNFLLDEPMSGLDPQSSREIAATLDDLRNDGCSILIATHDLPRAKQLGDKVGILSEGSLVAEFSALELEESDLEAVYLEHFRFESSPSRR